jgi:small-conductance mechanosensitive channel
MPEELAKFLDQIYFSNTIRDYLIAVGIFLATIAVSWLIKKFVLRQIKKISEKTETKLDDLLFKLVNSVGSIFYFVLGVNLAIQSLNISEIISRGINTATLIILIFYLVGRVQEIISYIINAVLTNQQEKGGKQFDASLANFLSLASNIALWLIALLIILQNLNINVTALVGGLGITGIAVAFALQNVLGDIIASISIYFDRPFKVGDFIIIGQDMGTVEKIGIKSTRIKSVSGELLVVSNKELSEIRIQNHTKLKRRRREFILGITYETSNEKLRQIPDIVKNIVESIDICEFERTVFEDFADFSLNYKISYHVKSKDMNVFMEINQKINLEIKEQFEKLGIDFAYPTTLMLTKKA